MDLELIFYAKYDPVILYCMKNNSKYSIYANEKF